MTNRVRSTPCEFSGKPWLKDRGDARTHQALTHQGGDETGDRLHLRQGVILVITQPPKPRDASRIRESRPARRYRPQGREGRDGDMEGKVGGVGQVVL